MQGNSSQLQVLLGGALKVEQYDHASEVGLNIVQAPGG